MMILKAKKQLNKKTIFKISDLSFVKHGLVLKDLLKSKQLINPIEVKIDKHTGVMGAGGIPYVKKHFCVYRGSRRVTTAIQLGYTHIEGVIID